jgi:aerotaxis receptor
MVKNRRKDGDHYWVMANATPVCSGGRIVGYLSVRSEPTREQVQAAEALYATMREEAATGRIRHALRGGRVVRRDPLGRAVQTVADLWRAGGPEGAAAACAALVSAALAAWSLPAGLAAAALLASAVAIWAWRRREAALSALATDACHLASGDLTHTVTTGAHGALGLAQLALAQTAQNLRTVIGEVQTEVLGLRGAVAEVAAGNQDLSSRTESQASSLQQTAASMEEINGTVRNTAAQAEQGARLAEESATATRQAESTVGATVQAMTAISESSRRIGEIIQVIEGIAFQTNILALNAAVVEQLAAAAQQLSGQVDRVSETISLFRLREGEATLAERDAVALRRAHKAAAAAPAATSAAPASGFDLDQAVAAHLQWKTKLRNAIDRGEKLDVDTVCRDDRCPLGQWIHGEGRTRWGHVPELTKLLQEHAAFHRTVGDVARQINAGQKEAATRALAGGTAFARATQATVMAIKALQRAIASAGKKASAQAPKAAPKPAPSPQPRQALAATADDWVEF